MFSLVFVILLCGDEDCRSTVPSRNPGSNAMQSWQRYKGIIGCDDRHNKSQPAPENVIAATKAYLQRSGGVHNVSVDKWCQLGGHNVMPDSVYAHKMSSKSLKLH